MFLPTEFDTVAALLRAAETGGGRVVTGDAVLRSIRKTTLADLWVAVPPGGLLVCYDVMCPDNCTSGAWNKNVQQSMIRLFTKAFNPTGELPVYLHPETADHPLAFYMRKPGGG